MKKILSIVILLLIALTCTEKAFSFGEDFASDIEIKKARVGGNFKKIYNKRKETYYPQHNKVISVKLLKTVECKDLDSDPVDWDKEFDRLYNL
jgi:hypothetical protein